MNKIKKIISDTLYVSKLTKTNKKKLIIFIVVLLSQLTAATDILIIVLFSTFIAGIPYSNPLFVEILEFILQQKFLFPLLVLMRFAFIYMQQIVLKNLELNIQRNLKVYLLREVFDKRNYSVADAYFYINSLSNHVSFFYSNVTTFINSTLQIFAYALYLFLSDSNTIMAFGIGAAILSLPSRFLIAKSRKYMHQNYEFGLKASAEIQRIIDNMFLIKILKKDEKEINRFSRTVGDENFTAYKNFKYGAVNNFLPTLITMFIFSVLLVSSSLAKNLTLDFIGVTLRLFQSLGSVTNSINKIINSNVHMEALHQLDKNKLEINKNNFIYKKENSDNPIELKNLSFKYFNSEEYIFENINLSIKSNTHNILTGPNGSGKSTLLGLMSGVLYCQNGTVTTGHKNFGYIGATPLIFTGSLRENLLYGNDLKINDKKILSMLEEFKTFKESSSYDLERLVDNKSLSSGQMQKIAFVRALLSDIDILLLDESTANLDEYSREYIFNKIKENRITIVNSTHDPEKFLNVDNHIKIEIIEEKRVVNSA